MATVYPFRLPTNAGQGPSRQLDHSFSAFHHLAPSHSFNLKHQLQSEGLESRLMRFEAEAWEKCLEAIEDLPDIIQEEWFMRQMDSQIIPALKRIGFDESFARLLFQTAAPGWQRMGPFPNKCTLLHPNLIKNLKAVRHEILSKTGSQLDFSWIVLPRVYHFLKEEHSAYLLCYLDHLATEPASEFRRILTRIIIEFVGNYTLKFRSSILPRCLIDSALFYGFEAMFWKNLRNPPPDFEEDLIFNHCLRWNKLMRTKCAELNDDMLQSIRKMEAYRQRVMLTEDALYLFQNGQTDQDLTGLLVTLRHGRPGMAAAIKFMGDWLNSFRQDPAGNSLYAMLPAALNRLFHFIKLKLPDERPEVQNSLLNFLHGLKEQLVSSDLSKAGNPIEPPEQLRFVVQRMLGLVNGMTASLV